MTRDRYEFAIAAFRSFGRGTVTEVDWTNIPNREPYRHGTLDVRGETANARYDGADLAALAAQTGGYLCASVHGTAINWSVSAARDLAPSEVCAAAPSAPVSA